MAVKAKHQRLVLAVIALLAILGAGLLAASALKDQAAYFYTPSELAKARPEVGKAIRLGGMVEGGSIKRDPDGVTVRFTVIDQTGKQAVVFKGITPDLFVENSGVVAEGAMAADGTFVAENLLAKHDENYKPKELKDMDMDAMRKAAESME